MVIKKNVQASNSRRLVIVFCLEASLGVYEVLCQFKKLIHHLIMQNCKLKIKI